MANYANCGDMNTDNTQSTKSASEIALENAQKEFETDAKISVDKSKLTYVCELCGTINRLGNSSCSKCGKPRPRSEYINALRKFKNDQREGEEILAQRERELEEQRRLQEEQALAELAEAQQETPKEPEQPEEVEQSVCEDACEHIELPLPEEEPEKPVAQPVQPEVQQPATVQTQSVVQPFVIVPYVNPQQQVWQYQPRQLYRFEPYTVQEKAMRADMANDAAYGTQPTIDDLFEIRNRKQGEIEAINDTLEGYTHERQQRIERKQKKKKIRNCSIATFVFSIILLLVEFLLPIFKGVELTKGVQIIKYLGNCLKAFDIDIGISTSNLAYFGPASIILPIAFIVIAILTIVMAIMSIARMKTGKAKSLSFIIPIICQVFAIGALVVLLTYPNGSFDYASTMITKIGYCLYSIIVIELALFIIGLVTPRNK